MINKFMKAMARLHKGQRGMTGLETAIILIAFVTVAAVFGYAVLSAGIFSAEKGKEAVYAGLEQAQSSMELKGSVIAYGAPGTGGLINDCEDGTKWDDSVAGVTSTTVAGFGGGHSVQFALASANFTGGPVGSDASAIGDLTEKAFVNLYVWTDTAITGEAGDQLQMKLLDTNPAVVETLNLPAIAAESWTLVTLNLVNPATDVDIEKVELHYTNAAIAADMLFAIDNIVAGPPYTHAELVVFTVANAIAGRPINLAPSPDNATVISYTDSNTYEPDITWSVSFVGQNDGDNLLEPGEQAQIKVSLGFLGTPVGPNSEFGLQVKPPHGSVVTIERTIPANIDGVMDLY